MFEKQLKKIDLLDISLIKAGSMAFILFLITIWPAAMAWVHSVGPWWFLGAMILLMIRPLVKFLKG